MVQDPSPENSSADPARTEGAFRGTCEHPNQRRNGRSQGEERDEAVLKINSQERTAEGKIACAFVGLDLTFSAPKSVSVSWALADRGTQAVVFAAHQQSLAYVVGYAEQCVFTSRSGKNGVVQEEFRGIVGTASAIGDA